MAGLNTHAHACGAAPLIPGITEGNFGASNTPTLPSRTTKSMAQACQFKGLRFAPINAAAKPAAPLSWQSAPCGNLFKKVRGGRV